MHYSHHCQHFITRLGLSEPLPWQNAFIINCATYQNNNDDDVNASFASIVILLNAFF
uniref:Uncharacterized protein n=1 Tax=Rhizophora mucronata TaxID=61149 RepID=A0A2P2PAY9_RHIMU